MNSLHLVVSSFCRRCFQIQVMSLKNKKLGNIANMCKGGPFMDQSKWLDKVSSHQSLPKSPPKVLKNREVLLAAAEMACFDDGYHHGQSDDTQDSEPQINYLSEKGMITGVAITCTCGKEIVLKFDYENKKKTIEARREALVDI